MLYSLIYFCYSYRSNLKLVAIGDLHGKNYWKKIDFDQFDKIVFIGDYTDSFTYPDETIYQNLMDLIALKKANPKKIILLLGNHDLQYLHYPEFPCTGFRPEAQKQLTACFRENKKYFQVAWQRKNYLFTHAGVTNKWFEKYEDVFRKYDYPKKNLGDVFNMLHNHPQEYACLFDCSTIRGGFANHGGIFWADAEETMNDYLTGLHQVVGHTPVMEMARISNGHSSIVYIDVLDQKAEFLELEI